MVAKNQTVLEKQVISVPLGIGLDESVNPDLVDNKAVTLAENCVYDQYLRTKRTTGFKAASQNYWNYRIEDVYSDQILNILFENCFLLDSQQYINDTVDRILVGASLKETSSGYTEYYHLADSCDSGSTWNDLGYLVPCKQRTIATRGLDCAVIDADCVATSDYIYSIAVNGVYRTNLDITVVSITTVADVYTATVTFLNQQENVRCTKSPTMFFAICKDSVTSFISYINLPLDMSTSPGSGTLIGYAIDGTPDLEWYLNPSTGTEGNIVVGFVRNSTGNLVIARFHPVSAAGVAIYTPAYSAEGVVLGYLDNRVALPTTARIGVLYNNDVNEIKVLVLDDACTGNDYGPTVVGTAPLVAAPAGGGLMSDHSHTDTSHSPNIRWWFSPDLGRTSCGSVAWDSTSHVHYENIQGWTCVSKPFRHLGRAHIWLQNTWGSVVDDPKMVLVTPEPHSGSTGWMIPVTSAGHDEVGFNSGIYQFSRVSNPSGNIYISIRPQILGDQNRYAIHRLEIGTDKNRARFSGKYIDAGGGLKKLTCSRLVPVGFYSKPVIHTLTANTPGSLTPSTTYTYHAVYEYTDPDGDLHRSMVSDLKSITLGAGLNPSVDVQMRALSIGERTMLLKTRLVVYRNTPTDTNYHYVGSVLNDPDATSITFTDTISDATCETGRLLYTTGGILQNECFRPAGLVYQQNERIWFVPDQYPTQLWSTKYLASSVAPESSYVLSKEFPEEIVALAELSGRLIVFGKEKMYIFNTIGGPSDLGLGAYNDIDGSLEGHGLRPTTSFAATTSQGVLYQRDTDGMVYLSGVPGSTSVLGLKAENTLGTITDAIDIDQNQQIVMLSSSNKLITYDYKHNQWSTSSTLTDMSFSHIGHGRQHAYYLIDDRVGYGKVYYADGLYKYGTYLQIYKRVRTGWIKPGVVAGYQRVWWVDILGKFPTNSGVNVRVYYNYNDTSYTDYSFTNTTDIYTIRLKPAIQKCNALSIEISETTTTPIELTSVELECAIKTLHAKPAGKNL